VPGRRTKVELPIFFLSVLPRRALCVDYRHNIAAHETLFRLGIAADLFCGVILIFLTLALYRLFKGVDQGLAVLMVIVGGILPAAIDFFNVLNDAATLMLVRGPDFLTVFDKPQRDALAMLFLRLHHQEIVAAEVFWVLWLFPLVVLTIRSGFLPRFLGYWLIINGFAYLAISFTGLMLPQYEEMVSNIAFPALFGELAFMLWILIMGAKERPSSSDSGQDKLPEGRRVTLFTAASQMDSILEVKSEVGRVATLLHLETNPEGAPR
jgi:hypothetical protein